MRKKTIWNLTIVLSITLIGLILLQIFWIKNAIKIKEQQFDQIVGKSIVDIIDEVDKKELIYQVSNETGPYYSSSDNSQATNYKLSKLKKSKYGLRTTDKQKEIFTIGSVDSLSLSTDINLFSNTRVKKNVFKLNSDKKKKILSNFGLDSRYASDLSNKTVFVENVVNKLIQVDIELKDRIDKNTLANIIKEKFDNNNINIDFEFGVSGKANKIIYSSDNYIDDGRNKIYSGRLFPDDFFAKNNFLNIYFPSKKEYIFNSTGLIAISSIILTLVVIMGFVFSIHIMFKQKRLAVVKNDFVNNMTHELKTPISTISLAAQMLKDKSIAIEKKNIDKMSKIIDDESKRLSFQVEKVLKTALLDRGKIKLNKQELDIHNLISNVISNFQIQIENKNGTLTHAFNSEINTLNIDEVHFTNIIFNLLDNAVKYCNEAPNIKVLTENNKKGITISIADNGIGIKKSDQKKVFEQFYRVHTGNRHDVKGFGLGLNYVKRIVDEHNGNISISSTYKKGTKFKIFIPTNN
ncbi:MAG: HAMP domain-containing sensor histidine kinase [Bacteroidota bacterium]|nr:HAMP domain-containing sensor histidine kinase [Bacteroidota bacterium]